MVGACDAAGVLGSIGYAPVITLLAAVRGVPVENAPGGVWTPEDDTVLGSVHRVDAKPGRATPAGMSVWVAHAHEAWSRANVDGERDEHHAALLEAFGGFASGIGLDVSGEGGIAYSSAHRWRFGRAVEGPTDDAWFDGDSMLALSGDGFGTARSGSCEVERAWLSGQAAAGRVLTWFALHHPDHAPGSAARGAAATLFSS